ncbi:MAG: energy-coupling factor ABC transporter permease [Nitrospirae bacterium]|nr:energy-coupling factor ABC transporter permease [Nitrospirota bacterium]
MHMADALLSPAVGATFWAGTLGTIAYCSKKLKENLDEKLIPLMGVFGAFIFAAQMINFTIPATGSSGHLGGGLMLAIVLGPHAAFIVMASVLTVQALFFADGGLLALGCNIWNLGIYPCFIAYPLIYKPLVKPGSSSGRIMVASVISGVIGLQFGAFSVVLQTLLSERSELPFNSFLLLMQPVHLAIGLAEGFVTAGVINFVRAARPEILESAYSARPVSAAISIRKFLAGILIATVVIGGALSWFASSNPDGLEWSIRKLVGSPGLREAERSATPALTSLQGKTALLPDYNFRQSGEQTNRGVDSGPASHYGTSVSGIAGAGLVLFVVLLIGMMIRSVRRKSF